MPDNTVETVTLAGGQSENVGPTKTKMPQFTDYANVSFTINDPNHVLENGGNTYNSRSASVSIRALRKGSATIIAKYNGAILKQYTVVITSDWQEYLGYCSWRKSVESQIWTGNMSLKDKLDAACNYIKTEFSYKLGYGQAVLIYSDKMCDCFGSTEIFGDFAKDAGAQVKYASTYTGQMYDYLADAVTNAGHLFNKVLLNGQWVNYDACPLP